MLDGYMYPSYSGITPIDHASIRSTRNRRARDVLAVGALCSRATTPRLCCRACALPMKPVLLFGVAAYVAALPAAPPQAGARSLTAKAHKPVTVTIPTGEQAFAEYAAAALQTMPAKVRHVLVTHFEACLDHQVVFKGLDTTTGLPSEHEAFVSSAHACLRHARAATPLVFKAALDAIVAFDRADEMATGRRLQNQPTCTTGGCQEVVGEGVAVPCALLQILLFKRCMDAQKTMFNRCYPAEPANAAFQEDGISYCDVSL